MEVVSEVALPVVAGLYSTQAGLAVAENAEVGRLPFSSVTAAVVTNVLIDYPSRLSRSNCLEGCVLVVGVVLPWSSAFIV